MTPSGGRDITEAQRLLGQLLDGEFEGPVSLFFGSSPDEDGLAEFRDVPIYAELARELLGLLAEWRRRANKDQDARRLREYNSEPQPEDSRRTQFIDSGSDEHIKRAMSPFDGATDIPTWTREDKTVGKPWSFVISAKLKRVGPVRFYGRITAGQQLKGSGRVVAFLEGRRFQGLEESNAIILDPDIDCIEIDGYLLIFNALRFESLFAYATSLVIYATKTIDEIQDFIDPAKLTILREQVGSNRAYLRRVAGRIRIDLKTADHARIKQAIERCGFDVTFDDTGGKLKLGFKGNDPADLIKLLTDRGVESMITGQGYIAGTLEPVGPPAPANTGKV